jgi:hypothetical protein
MTPGSRAVLSDDLVRAAAAAAPITDRQPDAEAGSPARA